MPLITRLSAEKNLMHAQDGYIRLTFQHFCALRFPKRITFNDDDLRDELLEMDLQVAEAGYCEWLDLDERAQVSIGWAWFVTSCDHRQRVAPGGVSCNVMFTTAAGVDLGSIRTAQLLNQWLANCSWRDARHFLPLRPDSAQSSLLH